MVRLISAVLFVLAVVPLRPAVVVADDHFAIDNGRVTVACSLTVGGGFDARTSALEGTLTVAANGDVAGRAVVDLTTLRTGIGLRDRHLQETYLETERDPAFRQAVLEDIKLDRASNAFSGLFTAHGRQRPVSGEVTLRESGQSVRVDAAFVLKLSEYDITPPRYLGIGVGDEVKVRVSFTAAPAETSLRSAP
jgi:polyisoprenoid-binding protein YceI